MSNKNASTLMEDLKKLFRERYTKDELMRELGLRLTNYRYLKDTPFQAAINNFIVLRAEEDAEILIHDDEIGQIWNL